MNSPSMIRERLLDALEAAGREPDLQHDGWVNYRCLEHEDTTPSAYLGTYGYHCHSCQAKGSFKDLAERLKLGIGGADWAEWKRKQPERDAKRRAEREEKARKVRQDVALIWPSLKMTAQGRWYLDEHRGLSADFAERYGVKSFHAGIWPADRLKPPGPIRRRGGLIIPYFRDPEGPPVGFRVRAALPDEYTKCPTWIKEAARSVGQKPKDFWPEPSRYWAPSGSAQTLFNEVALRSEDPIPDLWVAEGEMDALTLLEQGFTAVGLPGKASAWKRLGFYLERRDDIGTVHLVPDNEPDTIQAFQAKAQELALISSAKIVVDLPVGSDLDASLRGAPA